jgi:4-carboxymuconolactone decarboxylase
MGAQRAKNATKEGKMGQEPSAVQKRLGDFAPKLAELTGSVLFGDIWERPGLSKRDRSLITVAALVALYRPEQLRFHLNKAMDNGLSKDELIEVITHLAFYSGWPTAMTAITVAQEVMAAREA